MCFADHDNIIAQTRTPGSSTDSPDAGKPQSQCSKTIHWIRHGQAYNNIGESPLSCLLSSKEWGDLIGNLSSLDSWASCARGQFKMIRYSIMKVVYYVQATGTRRTHT